MTKHLPKRKRKGRMRMEGGGEERDWRMKEGEEGTGRARGG